MLTRIQHIMLDFGFFQHLRQGFRFLNRSGANQNWLTFIMRCLDFFDDRGIFFICGPIHAVIFINARDRAVRWHFYDAQLIDFHEFFSFGIGGTGHACQFIIKPEIILKRHAGQGNVFCLNRTILFGFDGLV